MYQKEKFATKFAITTLWSDNVSGLCVCHFVLEFCCLLWCCISHCVGISLYGCCVHSETRWKQLTRERQMFCHISYKFCCVLSCCPSDLPLSVDNLVMIKLKGFLPCVSEGFLYKCCLTVLAPCREELQKPLQGDVVVVILEACYLLLQDCSLPSWVLPLLGCCVTFRMT